jgi:hypothetical protein
MLLLQEMRERIPLCEIFMHARLSEMFRPRDRKQQSGERDRYQR